jgi:hypothetical protein
MISADFYPNYYTYNSGNIITDTTNNIPVTTEDFSDMYYLGWIRPENLPQMFKMAECSQQITSDDVIYRWDTITPTNSNYNCGYLVKTPNGYANIQNYAILSRNDSTGIWQHGGATDRNNNWAFPNKLDVMKEGAGLTKLAILACRFNSDDTYQDRWIWTGGGTLGYQSFDFNAMIEFLYGDGSLQITSGGYTLTFKKSDFDEDGTLYKNFDNSEYKCKLFICGYDFSFARDSNSYPTCCPSFFTSFTDINGKKWVTTGNLINYNQYWAEGSGMVTTWHGGYVGTLRRSELQSMISPFYASETGKPFVYNGTVLAIRTDNNATYWYSCIYPPDAIAKHYALIIRASTVNSNGVPLYGYTENSVYAPYVTEDNEFTATLITGDLEDDEFKAKLRPWQYDVDQWADNDYTEDDLPPYEPGGDGDDQGSNTGSVLRPTTLGVGGTNGFITQYSLTAAQIAEIGRLLWYKFSDASAVEQYVKNYMFFTVSTTGTLNLSNLLDYFVSLRVYPFPLINVPSHAAAGQDMWIGAGIVPLTFSTNLHTINNYADYIDAGYCTIPRYYNDFRDFAHTQIMLYLPYCGTVQLNPADVVGSTLHAQYAVDFATGGVTAYVDCTTWDGSQFVIAVLTGSIGADIPLTASNAAQIAARIAGDALNFAGTVGEAVSADVGRSAQAIGSAATGDVVGAAIGVANTYAGRIGGALDVAQTGLQIATAEGVKMPMLSGGRGFGSFGAPQTAYLQIRRGIYAEGQQPPQGFKEAYGEAYAKPEQVSSCAGFTVFANVDTSGLQCDAMEREQVKKMMQAGIYI